MRKYELWIDESGSFEPENERKTSHGWQPSLVGGVLVEAGKIRGRTLADLVNEEALGKTPHAMNMDQDDIRHVVLPALRKLVLKYDARLVYFQNIEHFDMWSNRELYLRLLAGGIVQLMEMLGRDGAFILDVTIAIRFVPQSTGRLDPISDEEYVRTIRSFIRDSWKRGDFDIRNDCRLNLCILSARHEKKLQLADYACNAKLTQCSGKFDNKMRQQFQSLLDKSRDYFFSVNVNLSENKILSALARGNTGDALFELYTSRGDFDHSRMKEKIFEAIRRAGYRMNRLQLNQFASAIVTYARSETDFEECEKILLNIKNELFQEYRKEDIHVQMDEAEFQINLYLADMYLREGDLNAAGNILDDLEKIIRQMNYRAENLKYLYLYQDKKALFEINGMNYGEAAKLMQKSIDSIENVLDVLEIDQNIQRYFEREKDSSALRSEYLGNAYCMKIYAEMFMQREDTGLYARMLRADTEKALAQYEYEGELERNQQYRAHVEMEQKNYEDALAWLLKTKLGRNYTVKENKRTCEADCIRYLDGATDEDKLSRTYYLMYYVEIMYEALREDRKNWLR